MPGRELVGLVYNPLVPEALGLATSLVDSLGLQQRSWVASATDLEIAPDTLSNTSAVITAGGDGTILRVARLVSPYEVPIVGINMGRVGFMTELTVEEAPAKLPEYLNGASRVEERMMLRASLGSPAGTAKGREIHALNDVVVSRGAAPQLLDINVTIDGVELTTYRADGVIVSTATGSTGYALSAGGPVLHPEARSMLLQPVAAHMSLRTGLIVRADSTVELAVGGGDDAVLSVDSFAEASVGREHSVRVERSRHVARFLRAEPPSTFYANLTHRLGIAGPRAAQRPKS